MRERLKTFIWFLPFLMIVACKQDKHSHEHSTPILGTVTPEGFDEFYNRFHTDSTYQMEHILFPLKEKQDQSNWEAAEWIIHKNPLLDTENVSRQIRTLSGLVIEVIYHNDGFYLIERRFLAQEPGEWQLIYYIERSNLQDWERVYEESGIEINAGH